MLITILILQIIFVPLISPLAIGFIKKIKAKLQNRRGASIFQPYKDLWKLLHKDEVISSDASWIFKVSPYIIFSITVIVGASIPLFSSVLINFYTTDILVIVYLLSIGTFFLALSGMDTGNSFGGFGSSREMTISAMAEGGLIFSLLTMAIISGTTNLFEISNIGLFAFSKSILSVILAFIAFFIVLLAENGRFPYDNPDTHLELTMIHEAMILEYSGKKLALMEWAGANKFIIFTSLCANIFFPFGIAQSVSLDALSIGIIVLIIKIIIFCLIIGFLESKMSKFRFFRLPDLLIVSFIISIVAIGLINQL
ncbi:formate hydrogenlyase [Candidatus Nomurabacteria bacterium RIFCSPHIGHO2_01_FULL_37_25]|uniref:Formate hydrogenlyase n=1 Tax=Candidatus Nomurabacteria bacterium RIFCSPLOWO2_01_FULL_36_16 TaxID=1801767 RepID=A0A1F6WYG4_9BACT|nr:MAG: formate hydrogenlyase [Candidatus Nomurabacteria bacterium RIFCSPHIGHO2_01_FULL_37_25]OGI75419.1 MAG: formate hydrogenlyase [Candidatus Nomurabacteria bacterium RIFCSPHIGHO2_02_FULL_36_29]OGI86918.1 MAG: formate hydrogenlyase [Candidatus Nomurabacteria bacterium RIFCSPLOWO2_01_FULL_36_16]OGI96816.1 MAG: formate hydrogenlyase [Candidatus Nomurabacteria bacterium RIFCSPLOWO2_02_FULL_36_8]